jgi:hypothetical protein
MSFVPHNAMIAVQVVCKYNPPTIGIVYKNKYDCY